MGSSLAVASASNSLVEVPGLLTVLASPVEALGLSSCTARGILLDQRLNLGLPHWQADTLPLSHQESPGNIIL